MLEHQFLWDTWRLFVKLKLEYTKSAETFSRGLKFWKTIDKILEIADNQKFLRQRKYWSTQDFLEIKKEISPFQKLIFQKIHCAMLVKALSAPWKEILRYILIM